MHGRAPCILKAGTASGALGVLPSRMVRRLAIVGTGLIGASVGLAAREAGVKDVCGWDVDAEALRIASERGAVDAALSLGDAVGDAELAVVAAPVASLPSEVAAVLEASGNGTTVTDVGSTKGAITSNVTDARFIGGHPVCGSEARGPAHATGELFRGATWFLTPVAATDPNRYRTLHGFVASLGAIPVAVDPQAHDRLVALTSHLPHALANLLLNQAGTSRIEGHDPLAAAGGSLRRMTRAAEAYEQPGALQRLRVHVPDRPGVLAGITQALGAARINIEDFELHHMSRERGGTLTLLVSGEDDAQRASDLLEAQGYSVVIAPVIDE